MQLKISEVKLGLMRVYLSKTSEKKTMQWPNINKIWLNWLGMGLFDLKGTVTIEQRPNRYIVMTSSLQDGFVLHGDSHKE